MRRKKLLLLLLAGIMLGSYSIAQLLPTPVNTEVTYIHLDNWGEPQDDFTPPDVEIPRTGEATPTSILSVLTPHEVAMLAPKPVTDMVSEDPAPSAIINEIILGLLGAGIVALGAYLTYQHFMR